MHPVTSPVDFKLRFAWNGLAALLREPCHIHVYAVHVVIPVWIGPQSSRIISAFLYHGRHQWHWAGRTEAGQATRLREPSARRRQVPSTLNSNLEPSLVTGYRVLRHRIVIGRQYAKEKKGKNVRARQERATTHETRDAMIG